MHKKGGAHKRKKVTGVGGGSRKKKWLKKGRPKQTITKKPVDLRPKQAPEKKNHQKKDEYRKKKG